jgi:2',3'-cyclic-nucleotide 2'-phosphodiesterase (5'-nucleotidase family)
MVTPSSLVCSKDDAPMVTIVNSQVYDLGAVGNWEYLAKFIENSDATLEE